MIYVQEFYTQLCVFTHYISNRSTYSMNTTTERTSELMGTGVLEYDCITCYARFGNICYLNIQGSPVRVNGMK
jgi:hypothetical protein